MAQHFSKVTINTIVVNGARQRHTFLKLLSPFQYSECPVTVELGPLPPAACWSPGQQTIWSKPRQKPHRTAAVAHTAIHGRCMGPAGSSLPQLHTTWHGTGLCVDSQPGRLLPAAQWPFKRGQAAELLGLRLMRQRFCRRQQPGGQHLTGSHTSIIQLDAHRYARCILGWDCRSHAARVASPDDRAYQYAHPGSGHGAKASLLLSAGQIQKCCLLPVLHCCSGQKVA
jgi:hypothetical protein